MKARSEGSLFSKKACLKISSIGCPFIVEIQLHRGSDVQASYTEEQKKIACETSSFSALHTSQVASCIILLLHKLAFVGRASLHALQTKIFYFARHLQPPHLPPKPNICHWYLLSRDLIKQEMISRFDRVLTCSCEGPNECITLWGCTQWNALNCCNIYFFKHMLYHICPPTPRGLINQDLHTGALLPIYHG